MGEPGSRLHRLHLLPQPLLRGGGGGDRFAGAVRAKVGQTVLPATGYWAGEGDREAEARFLTWNVKMHQVRGRIEKVFGTWKRSFGLRRMRWRGLGECRLQIYLIVSPNLRRTLTVLAPA